MQDITKKIAIIATAMIGLGIILAIIGGMTGGMDPIHFGKDGFTIGYGERTILKDLKTEKKRVNEFTNLEGNVELSDIEFVQGDEYAVEYTYNEHTIKPTISSNGTNLIINQKEHFYKKHHFLQGFHFLKNTDHSTIKIYYPKDASFHDINIQNSAGNVQINDAIAKKIELELDLGEATLSNVKADHLSISISAGNCNLSDVTTLKGDLSLDLGDLETKNFNSKDLEVEVDAGNANLQGTFTGKNIIDADLGEVVLTTTLPEKDYNYNVEVDLGDVEINGSKTSSLVKSSDAANHIKIESSLGDVKLNFQ